MLNCSFSPFEVDGVRKFLEVNEWGCKSSEFALEFLKFPVEEI